MTEDDKAMASVPIGKLEGFELRGLLGAPAIQLLMDDFSSLTDMATAILDLKGEILVASGWRDICTQFHRVHPEACGNCHKSDLFLSKNLKPDEHVAYKCLNQLWDVVTPLMIDGKHAGNVFTGQFLYEDEPVDLKVFEAQAERYGFDKTAYLAALERVPRVSRDRVKLTMDYLVKFAKQVAAIGLSNLQLSRAASEERRLRQELSHAKSYIDNIINSMPSVLVTVDGEGRVTQWNNTAEEQTHRCAANVLGRRLEEVFPRFATDMAAIKRSIRERSVEKRHAVARQEGGEIRYDDITIYPLVTNGVQGAVIRVDDKTEQKRLEDMMIQSEKMLSLGGLAAGMAHEINNPLAGIVQGVQNLKRRLLDDIPANRKAAELAGLDLETLSRYMRERQVDQMVGDIMAGGLRAAEIVNNMLSFARKDSGGKTLCSLPELLDKAVELAANDFDLKGKYDFRHMEIVREYQADAPPIRCEPSKLQQVFLNILKNGAAAMNAKQYQSGGPRFVLRVRPAEGALRVEIEDNGPGMDAATLKRVFEPFFTTREVGGGTGLGMSVSYFIVKTQHHGEMLAESEPGKGTKFVVELPLEGATRQDG